jgi:hypothetical protein
MFMVTGLFQELGLKVSPATQDHFKIYPLFHGKKEHGDQTRGGTDQVRAAELLATYIGNFLDVADYALTENGQSLITHWAGEIIANAEDHSGQDDWYVIAYMEKTADGTGGECHLVVLGFGRTIFESLNDESTPAKSVSRRADSSSSVRAPENPTAITPVAAGATPTGPTPTGPTPTGPTPTSPTPTSPRRSFSSFQKSPERDPNLAAGTVNFVFEKKALHLPTNLPSFPK